MLRGARGQRRRMRGRKTKGRAYISSSFLVSIAELLVAPSTPHTVWYIGCTTTRLSLSPPFIRVHTNQTRARAYGGRTFFLLVVHEKQIVSGCLNCTILALGCGTPKAVRSCRRILMISLSCPLCDQARRRAALAEV